MAPDHKIQALILKITFMLRGASPLAWMIPAEVPRRARDPEFTEGAGIQQQQAVLDPGDPVPAKAGSRGDVLTNCCEPVEFNGSREDKRIELQLLAKEVAVFCNSVQNC